MVNKVSGSARMACRTSAAILAGVIAAALLAACPSGLEPDTTPPGDVSNLSAVAGDEQVTLTWTDPGDADLKSIEIQRTGSAARVVVAADTQTAVVTGLANGTAYTFTVKAVDTSWNVSAGKDIARTPVSANDVTPPLPVENLDATPGNGQVTLTWLDPVDANLAYIQVTHNQTGGDLPRNYAAGLQGATISLLVNGTAYTFTVRAVDGAGNLSEARSITETPDATVDSTPPADVTDLAATEGLASVTLSWTEPADADLHHIEITHDRLGGDDPVFVASGIGAATLTGLANGTPHIFTVKTVDASGNRSAGATQTGTPSAFADDTVAPANVGSLEASVDIDEVTLTWTDPGDTDFHHVAITWVPNGSVPRVVLAGVETATITGLEGGTAYTFTVVAYDDKGNGNTSTPATRAATPLARDTTAPGPVTPIGGTPGLGSMTLAWTDPVDADLGHIEVTHDGEGGSTPRIVAAGIETVTILGLAEDVSHTFTLVARDLSGNGSAAATIVATTLATDVDAPAEVGSPAASPGVQSVTLTWTDPADTDFSYVEITHDSTNGTVPSIVVAGVQTATIYGLAIVETTFAIKTVDETGNASVGTEIPCTPIAPDTSPPAAVSALEAVPGLHEVTLTWTDPTEADFHHVAITHDQEGGTTPSIVVKGVGTVTITGLDSVAHVFSIRCYDADGNASAAVATTAVTPLTEDITPPAEVTSLGQVPGIGTVTLSWTEPNTTDFHHVAITHDQGGTTPRIVPKGTTSVTIPDLAGGTLHTFTVKTYDTTGNASDGTQIGSTPTAPDTSAPARVTLPEATAGYGEATLTWTDPEDLDFEGVQITEDGGAITPILVAAGIQQAVITGLTGGTTYTFYLKSYDTVGNFSAHEMAMVTPLGEDITPPALVTDPVGAAGIGRVTLTWFDPADADLNYLEVTHDQAGGTVPRLVAKGVQTLVWADLTNGLPYTFTVKSVDLAGNKSEGINAPSVTPTALPIGDVTVTITMNTPSDIVVDFTGDTLTLDKSVNQAMNVSTNRTAAESYTWYLDGGVIAGAVNWVTTISSLNLAPGLHDVALFVEEGGLLYSARFTFTVVNN